MKILSPDLRNAIRRLLDDVEEHHGILDVYKAARGIQRAYPDEPVALEDIVAAIMTGGGGIRAIEFDRQAVGRVNVPQKSERPVERSLRPCEEAYQ